MEDYQCKNCGECVGNRPRGLCRKCYFSLARTLYPKHRHGKQKGVGHPRTSKEETEDRELVRLLEETGEHVDRDIYGRFLPRHPTDAVPGTNEKILVMTERAKRGEALFHPLDNVYNPKRNNYEEDPEESEGEDEGDPFVSTGGQEREGGRCNHSFPSS